MIGTVIAAISLVAAACAGGGASAERTDTCLDMNEGNPTEVDCDEPHEFEVAAEVNLPDGPWPGDGGVQEAAWKECQPRVEAYIGASLAEAGLSATQLRPTEPAWNAGDREVACLIRTPEGFDRSVRGQGAEPVVSADGYLLSSLLREGDCISPASDIDEAYVQRVECSDLHGFEVAAVFDLPAGQWPGDDKTAELAQEHCVPAVEDYLGAPTVEAGVLLRRLYPSAATWLAGDRTVTCLIQTPDPASVSARDRGAGAGVSDSGRVLMWALAPGDCVSADSGLDGGFVVPVDCAEPHHIEVSVAAPFPGTEDDAFPGDAQLAAFADETCAAAFEARVGAAGVGAAGGGGKLDFDYRRPNRTSWGEGARAVVCLIVADDPVTGSAGG